MITVQEATTIVLEHTRDLGTERISLTTANGRILKEELRADRDFPPFDRVTMDGIAIRYETFAHGTRSFDVEGLQSAGSPQQTLQDAEGCIEIMTGAVLPAQSDTVIRYEDVEITDGRARILVDEIRHRQNVHFQGYDRKQGASLLTPNRRLGPEEIGVAATVGKHEILVAKLPRVAIISTGDELVGIDQTPLPYQIRSSNVHKIKASLERWGIDAALMHIVDDRAKTEEKLAACLQDYDAIILSGGVSKGKLDYVPEALSNLGVNKLFHRIRQRPGKPFWFGEVPGKNTIFALPGNPVSSFMCLNRYFFPWLRKSLGLEPMPAEYAALGAAINFQPDLTYFAQVQLVSEPTGQLLARPAEGHGSGDLANLVDANAFMELPRGQNVFAAGEVYPVIRY